MRVGELAEAVGVPDRILRRLAKMGVIPAKRLPSKKAHWNFAKADLDSIRQILTDAGVIEEPVKKKGGKSNIRSGSMSA
jgi:DNA-binding transcriptional MerR regulator